MCLIVWNWQPRSETPLVLLSNRDEYHARAALPMHWWANDAALPLGNILAGRDLQAGGTWLGVSRNGRLAAITNFRSGNTGREDVRSRGELVTQFLHSRLSAAAFLQDLLSQCAAYNPFNLLVFDGTTLMGLESRHARIVLLQPGWGGVSNADFNTPWPKLHRLRTQAQALPAPHNMDAWHGQALQLLHDRTPAATHELPQTGIAPALEHALSSIFITLPHYGTRASTVVTVGGTVRMTEQVHTPSAPTTERAEAFEPDEAPR